MSPSRYFVACFVACLLIIVLLAAGYKALAQAPCAPAEQIEAALVKGGNKVAVDLDLKTDSGVVLDNSVTKGIVSSVERTLNIGGKLLKLFQIDAASIGGNSGGSVLNERGELVGTLDAGMRGAGINFAVPISATKALLRRSGFDLAGGVTKKQDRIAPEKR